ncbi:DUF262 domain-containing protein [Saccharopolyspora sp. ASAGF58]|nr:DUF262 domain-containing protein [Saccharopolyspora sp. ASAGF58]
MENALASNLTSNTVNIDKLFDKQNFFKIPDYQRPFSWDIDNLSDLIDDLITAPRDADYFLGTLVLHTVSTERGVHVYDVVDGQQRLTSLCILLACLRDSHAFTDSSDVRRQIQEKIQQEKQSLSGIPARNRLRVRDLAAFDKVVITPGGTRDNTEIERAIGNGEQKYRTAVELFHRRLDSLSHPEVVNLAEFIVQRCVVVYLAASSFEEAFRLFTVVNDRGRQLRRIDVLKANNLAPHVIPDDEDRRHYAEKWEAMEEKVGEKSFEEIFRSMRLVYVQEKPQGDLLKEFENRILGKTGAPSPGEDFIRKLNDFVDLYDSLFISIDYLADDPNCSAKFETLMSAMVAEFNANEWRAAVLRFAEKFGKSTLYKFLLAIEKIFLTHWVQGVRKDERYSTYTERYSRALPPKAVEFERCDNADDGRQFGEASPIAGGEYFPVLYVGDASLDGRPY